MSEDLDPRVTLEFDGPVAVLALNYPERRNALDIPMREAIYRRLVEANETPECRVIVITGRGDHFSAGGDIGSMADVSAEYGRWRVRHIGRIATAIVESPKLVICAVEGFASGAGLSIASASDIVVCSKTARFAAPFGKLGLMADTGLIWTLTQRIGIGQAKSIVLAGATVTAEVAARIGLVEHLTDAGGALAKAMDLAREAAELAPLSISFAKSLFARLPQSLSAHIAAEADAQGILFATEDFAEGRASFLEKRKAVFRGK